MKTSQYVKELKRTNGLPQALKIAEKCMRASSAESYDSLPRGPIFFKEDKKGSSRAAIKGMEKVHNFWIEVISLLRKSK